MSPRTVTGRVARAAALTAALAAALTALLSAGMLRRWSIAQEDARLRAAADTLIAELGDAPTDAFARFETDEENGEVRAEGIRLSLWRGAQHLGGDAALVGPALPSCETAAVREVRSRRCVVAAGGMRVVAVRSLAAVDAAARAGALASLAAVAVTAALALLVSRRVASTGLAPLRRLADAVTAVDADAPEASKLPGAEGFAETDALRDALAELLARHARSLATARRFAADAAHELRTPLGAVRAELDLLAESLGPDAAAPLARARTTVTGLGTLAERLLVLAAPLDVATVAREAVSPADVVREAVAALPEARRARVALALDDDAVVAGDAALLRSLVDNALDNALTHAPEGAVTVHVAEEGDGVVVTVRDEGPGVAPGERARVFEAFYRAARSRAEGRRGHGVGLALVAHIARAHGGGVAFEDVPRGASLRVELPRWRA
ncbi:MAG: HAMP domain-containing sensor histidine kinase [Polyangiales bacterium]